MSLHEYLVAWMIQLCQYNNMYWLCEALQIFPRAKQLTCEIPDLQVNFTRTDYTKADRSETVWSRVLDAFGGVRPPTIKFLVFLSLLLLWGCVYHWLTNSRRMQSFLRSAGLSFLEEAFPVVTSDEHPHGTVEHDETSDYASLGSSEQSFLAAGGFDESLEHFVTVDEVQDFPGLFALLEVVICEEIAENTYFLRCEREKLGLTLIEASENSSLNRTFLEDLEFFRKISATGADFVNEAHALDVKEIAAIYDTREYLNSLQLVDQSFEARKFFAVVYHYEEHVSFGRFRTIHPTVEELMLILEDMTTSLRSLQMAAATCSAKIPSQLLISLVNCSHDGLDRSLTCLNTLGVSVRLNPPCLKTGVALDEMFASISVLRKKLETESEATHDSIDHLMKRRAIRTCTELLTVLCELLKFDMNVDIDVLVDEAGPFNEFSDSAQCLSSL